MTEKYWVLEYSNNITTIYYRLGPGEGEHDYVPETTKDPDLALKFTSQETASAYKYIHPGLSLYSVKEMEFDLDQLDRKLGA